MLLHIYDADDWLIRRLSWRPNTDVTVAVTGGPEGLIKALDKLVADGKTFDSAVFDTHGNAGLIAFDDRRIFADWSYEKGKQKISAQFRGRGYERLFPTTTRIYFSGCNVSEGGSGWQFLETAGSIFLRLTGGVVFAHDSKGYPLLPYALPLFFGIAGWVGFAKTQGHVLHPTGATRYAVIAPGGRAVERLSDDD